MRTALVCSYCHSIEAVYPEWVNRGFVAVVVFAVPTATPGQARGAFFSSSGTEATLLSQVAWSSQIYACSCSPSYLPLGPAEASSLGLPIVKMEKNLGNCPEWAHVCVSELFNISHSHYTCTVVVIDGQRDQSQ